MKLQKKLLALGALSFFAFGAIFSPAMAANANANAKAKVKTNTSVATTAQTSVTLQLNENLKFGSRGEAVKLLQSILAANPELFSSTDVTGYFGPKTQAAVKKLQKQKGLETVGIVGPKTRAILNAELSVLPLTESTNDQGQTCVKIPPGHLIAPGWLRKQTATTAEVTVPTCQILPPGILKKLTGGWTGGGGSTNDVTGPVISSIAISGVSTTTATLKFNTNENAVYEVMYGTTASYGTTSIKTTTFAKTHTFSFTGLTADTDYHYQIKAYDQAGNSTLSTDRTFSTVEADTTGPVISAIAATAITHNSATIYWTTNEASTSEVSYGTTDAYGSTSTDLTLLTLHSRTLTGLSANTTYHFQVKSKDGANNTSTSADMTFTTLVAPDTTAPVISAISATAITNSGATVGWTTNESATGKVFWSTTASVDKNTAPSLSTALGTSHSASIGGLSANTQYYYVIEAKDASLNTSTSSEGTFSTLP